MDTNDKTPNHFPNQDHSNKELDADDEKVLLLVTMQIDELALKSTVQPLSLDDVKKMTMLHDQKDKILGKRQVQNINIVEQRLAKELTRDQLLKELDKIKNTTEDEE